MGTKDGVKGRKQIGLSKKRGQTESSWARQAKQGNEWKRSHIERGVWREKGWLIGSETEDMNHHQGVIGREGMNPRMDENESEDHPPRTNEV